MTCPNCGGENLTDYPVCMACAPKCHAIGRIEIGLNCIHCDIQKEKGTALETYEFLQQVVSTWLEDGQFIPSDTEAAWALSSKLARLAAQASELLAKIEGGGK